MNEAEFANAVTSVNKVASAVLPERTKLTLGTGPDHYAGWVLEDDSNPYLHAQAWIRADHTGVWTLEARWSTPRDLPIKAGNLPRLMQLLAALDAIANAIRIEFGDLLREGGK